jgi:hypothetical protein
MPGERSLSIEKPKNQGPETGSPEGPKDGWPQGRPWGCQEEGIAKLNAEKLGDLIC